MLELNFSQTLGNHCLTINETLPANGITAIFGVSGAGKTSLINAISGLTRPQKGRIVLNGRVLNDAEKGICLTPEKRRVGYVFQDARLFPHYKVRGKLRYVSAFRLPMFLWFYNRRSKPAFVTYCGQKLLIVMTTTARWKWSWKSAVKRCGRVSARGPGMNWRSNLACGCTRKLKVCR